MKTQVSSERTYTVGYFKPGQRAGYGINVSVSGDQKKKTLREAKELLEAAQFDALEVHDKYFPAVEEPEKEGEQ